MQQLWLLAFSVCGNLPLVGWNLHTRYAETLKASFGRYVGAQESGKQEENSLSDELGYIDAIAESWPVSESNRTRIRPRGRCHFKTTLPMYYINLDRSPGRRAYVEEAFGCAGKLIRIPGVDGSRDNLDELIGFGGLTGHNMTWSEYARAARSNKGQIALTMSHAKAIKQAYDDGEEVAVILEDDASPVLAPFWPVSLEDLAKRARQESDAWMVVKLQYSLMQHNHAMRQISEMRENPGRMLGRGMYPSYGTVAYMIHRRGMKYFLNRWTDVEGKLDCLKPRAPRCVSDYLLFTKMRAFLAVPPYFVSRLFEDATGARGAKREVSDQYLIHYRFMLSSFQRAVEVWEFLLTQRAMKRYNAFIGADDAKAEAVDFTTFPSLAWRPIK